MKRRVLAVGVLWLWFAGFAFAQKTHINFDKSANFASYKTYAWEKSPNPAQGEWNQRILDDIDKQLQAKGLTKVDSNPDLWVVYSNSIRNEKETVGVGYGIAPTWGWDNGVGAPAVQNTYINKVGTLVVELADTKTKELIWRGSVSDTISDKTNKNVSTLDKAVTKLFKGYPPKEKK
jgi:hypothetical protein